MKKEEIQAELQKAWAKVYADYVAGLIHNETDMAISFAKHLATDQYPVISESLVRLGGTMHPDLLWTTTAQPRFSGDKPRVADVLAVIELKYAGYPPALIDTAKIAQMQTKDDKLDGYFAEAGFDWSRTLTHIRRDKDKANIVYCVAVMGFSDADACGANFSYHVHKQEPSAYAHPSEEIFVLQIVEPKGHSSLAQMQHSIVKSCQDEPCTKTLVIS